MNTQQKASAIESKVREVLGLGAGHNELHLEQIFLAIDKTNPDWRYVKFYTHGYMEYKYDTANYDYKKSFSENLKDEEVNAIFYSIFIEQYESNPS